MHILIDDKIPYIAQAAQQLGKCTFKNGADITRDDLDGVDALIVRTRTHCNRQLLEGTSVRLVVTATIGFDHLDTDFLEAAGIAWTNCPGCNATSVAQYVRNALLLASAEGIIDKAFALGQKPPIIVGIVGVGHVGTAVADALEAEGCRILRCDPLKGEPYTLAQLAEEADVITLHTPLTTDGPCPTFHLANADFFQRLRRQPLLINAARGECVDTEALHRALDEGLVRQVVVDVWEGEPEVDAQMLERAFIATPHVAGYSADGKANGSRMALETVAQHFGLEAHFDIAPPPLDPHYIYGELPYAPSAFSDKALQHLRRYNPLTDTACLKATPTAFEQLRGHYPFRRE